MDKKHLKILIAVALALLVLAVFLLMKKNQDNLQETTNNPPSQTPEVNQSDPLPLDWKTYSNQEYGFELRYPSNWRYEYKNGQFCFSHEIQVYETEGGVVCGVSVSFYPKDKPGALSIEELIRQRKEAYKIEAKEIMIGAEKGTLITGFGTETYVVHGGNQWVLATELGGEVKKVYFQILDSFKFLK